MIKLHRILMAGALLALATTTTKAELVGSLQISGGDVVLNNGTSLADTTSLTLPSLFAVGNGTGAFSTITAGTFASGPFTLDITTQTFAFTLGAVSFNATSIVVAPGRTSTFLPLFIEGNVTLNGTDSTVARINFSFSQIDGGGITGSGPLISPSVPEPSSVVLAGLGVAAAGLFGLRKRASK